MEYKNLQSRLFKAVFIDRVLELGSYHEHAIDFAIIDHAGTRLCDDLKAFKRLSSIERSDLYNFGKFAYQIHNDRKSVITTMIKATLLFKTLTFVEQADIFSYTNNIYGDDDSIIKAMTNSNMRNKKYVNFLKLVASLNIVSLDIFRNSYNFEYKPTTIELMEYICSTKQKNKN